jgi:DNA helicase-2/ATP-dependent DNA helicase PcrA
MSTTAIVTSPAIEAAQKAEAEIMSCINLGKSFRLEAGAGAGKTYSLVEALKGLIRRRGKVLLQNRQQIACITYTNAASEQIQSRIDKHPAVFVSTIHAFCWSVMSCFQPALRDIIPLLGGWPEKLAEIGGSVGARKVEYEFGHRSIDETRISIGHNDVIALMVHLMELPKFRDIFVARYPILFVDEYQDTNLAFAESIKKHFLGSARSPLIGFFGDHWQKIYSDVCGKIEHSALVSIDKGSNFRSVPAVVNFLNKLRPELPQAVSDPAAEGNAIAYHTNEWAGTRRTDSPWKEDLPPTEAHQYLVKLKIRLEGEGWIFRPEKTKILMLTNTLLAEEQGYGSFIKVYQYPDSYLRKDDIFIKFLLEKLEPMSVAYEQKKFGQMFAAIGTRTPAVNQHKDKQQWADEMAVLMKLRNEATIGAVLDHLADTARPQLPDRLLKRMDELEVYEKTKKLEGDKERKYEELIGLRDIPYSELIALGSYIDDKTPFSTKHGVKGLEFENVLIVFGRGWNNYNFNQMIEWFPDSIPTGKADTFERNRNLFYVACSRAKKRLALLFTQRLSAASITKLQGWIGNASVISLGPDPV